MQNTVATALLALTLAAAPAHAASGEKVLDQILKAGGERDASLMIYIPAGQSMDQP